MEARDNSGTSILGQITKAGTGIFKLVGVVLILYVVVIGIYGGFQYSATKSKLLTYGISDATGSLVAWGVMLVAFGLPALAVLRIIFFTGRPYDYAAAMILPLITWGIAQLPANFDAVTGEALKFCADRPGGGQFCLDRPGIDPITKRQLVAIDANRAERQFRGERGLVPKRMMYSPTIEFFDSLSNASKPEPKVWVAKNEQGCYDLFDSSGIHPQTGDPLVPVTRELVREIGRCMKTVIPSTAPVALAPPRPTPEAIRPQPSPEFEEHPQATAPRPALSPPFSRSEAAKQLVLEEPTKWRLRIVVHPTNDIMRPIGSFEFRALRCSGTLTVDSGQPLSEEKVFLENMEAGNCIRGCRLVVERGNRTYREECAGRVTGRGEFG